MEDEILTLDETAALLKLKPSQLRELTRTRTQVRSEHPIPFFKFHSKAIRFRRSAVERWIGRLAQVSQMDRQTSAGKSVVQ